MRPAVLDIALPSVANGDGIDLGPPMIRTGRKTGGILAIGTSEVCTNEEKLMI